MAKRYSSKDRELAKTIIQAASVPPDGWPYTDDFENNRSVFNSNQLTAWNRSEFWMLILAVRKKGGARGDVKTGKTYSAPPISAADRARVRAVMPRRRGDVDRIPYTPAFDTSFAKYNQGATSKLRQHEFWRWMLKIAKTRIRADAKPRVIAAVDGIVLAVNTFNTMGSARRKELVVIALHWSFEHLLQACIIQQGGSIRDLNSEHVIAYERSKNLGLNDASVQFLSYEDWKYLTWIQNIRGAAYHDLVEIDETELYVMANAGVQLCDKILDQIFLDRLADHLDPFVLPISTVPLADISLLMDRKAIQIRELLRQGEVMRARRAARSVVELETALMLTGPEDKQDGALTRDLIDRVIGHAERSEHIGQALSNTAAIKLAHDRGANVVLSLTGGKGSPVHGVRVGEDEEVVAYRPINPADKFTMSSVQICEKLGITTAVLTGVMRELKIPDNKELCYYHGRRGSSLKQPGYDPKVVGVVKEFLDANKDKEPLHWYRKHVIRKPRGSRR